MSLRARAISPGPSAPRLAGPPPCADGTGNTLRPSGSTAAVSAAATKSRCCECVLARPPPAPHSLQPHFPQEGPHLVFKRNLIFSISDHDRGSVLLPRGFLFSVEEGSRLKVQGPPRGETRRHVQDAGSLSRSRHGQALASHQPPRVPEKPSQPPVKTSGPSGPTGPALPDAGPGVLGAVKPGHRPRPPGPIHRQEEALRIPDGGRSPRLVALPARGPSARTGLTCG